MGFVVPALRGALAERLLLVSFTERQGRVRIISSRPTTQRERRDYERNTF